MEYKELVSKLKELNINENKHFEQINTTELAKKAFDKFEFDFPLFNSEEIKSLFLELEKQSKNSKYFLPKWKIPIKYFDGISTLSTKNIEETCHEYYEKLYALTFIVYVDGLISAYSNGKEEDRIYLSNILKIERKNLNLFSLQNRYILS